MIAQQAHLQVQTEQLRNALLSSVSHDLRTPLAVITGAASALADESVDTIPGRELVETISSEARRLNIDIAARKIEDGMEIEIADRGPGILAVGLGLTICRGIVAAHGGRLHVENRVGGGAAFRFTVPIEGEPPTVSDRMASE